MSDEIKEKTENQGEDKFSKARSAVERAILREQSYKSRNNQEQKENKALDEKPIISAPEKPNTVKNSHVKDDAYETATMNQENKPSFGEKLKSFFILMWSKIKQLALLLWKYIKIAALFCWKYIKIAAKFLWKYIKIAALFLWKYIKIAAKFLWKYIKIAALFLWKKLKQFFNFLKKKFSKKNDETSTSDFENITEESVENESEQTDEVTTEPIENAEDEKKTSKFEEQLKKFRESISLKIQKSKELHKTLVHYNTINKPFVEVYYYVNNELVKHNRLELMDYEIDGLVPSGYNRVASFITENSDDYSNFELVVSSDRIFKTTNAYPKMNKFKMLQLYSQEINQSVPGYKDKYSTSISVYNGEQSSIYYTYFIPIEIIQYFNKIAKSIKSRCAGVEIYSHFIFKSVSEHIKDDFVLHYSNDVFSSVILSYNGVFTTYFNAINDEQEIMTKYVSYISKHLLELEKKDTSNFYSNNKELVKFMGEDVKDIEIDFTKYHFNGVKL